MSHSARCAPWTRYGVAVAVTPRERAQKRHEHKHGRRHHHDPKEIARREHLRYGVSAFGNPATVAPQSGHLNPDQFVGFAGGFSTDAGNYTGVAAIDGAAGNGGAGGTGDAGSDGGGAGAAS